MAAKVLINLYLPPPFLLNKHKLYIKQLLSQIKISLPKPLQGRGCVPKSLSFYRKESLSPNPTTASPPAPLRMERGVKTIVCKERGRLVKLKKGSLHNEETPFCNREGRLFNFKIQLPLFPLTILSHPTSSIHSPLHSERGRG